MHIDINYTAPAQRLDIGKKRRAAENLCALVDALPPADKKLILDMGIEFRITHDKSRSAATYPDEPIIEISIQELSDFVFSSQRITREQKAAANSLQEEVTHLLDYCTGFSASAEWQVASNNELANLTHDAKTLMLMLRRANSCKQLEKDSITTYEETERPLELLAEIRLIKRELKKTDAAHDAIEKRMEHAFPHSYALAKKFDSLIDQEASNGSPWGGKNHTPTHADFRELVHKKTKSARITFPPL